MTSPEPGAMPATNAASEPSGLRRHLFLLAVLFVGAFTTALNVTMLSPLLTDIAEEFGVSDAATGQLAAITSICAGMVALLVAPLLDRYPRSRWLQIECTLLVIGAAICSLAPGYGVMLAGRVLVGIGTAVIGASCLAACTDLFTNPTERNRAMGIINTAFTIGAVLGLPLITQINAQFDWRIANAVLIPLGLLVILGTLRLPQHVNAPTLSIRAAWTGGYARVLRSPETLWLLGAMMAINAVWFPFTIYFSAMSEKLFFIGTGVLSMLFLSAGLGEVVAMNATPTLVRWRSAQWVGIVMAIVGTIDLLLIGIVFDGRWSLFPFVVIFGVIGAAAYLAIIIALIDSLPGATGSVMSLQAACLQVGAASGGALAGLALTLLDNDYLTVYRLMGLTMPITIFCFIMAIRARNRRPLADRVVAASA